MNSNTTRYISSSYYYASIIYQGLVDSLCWKGLPVLEGIPCVGKDSLCMLEERE